jgi:carbon monoxide dehydrogenase subunit G
VGLDTRFRVDMSFLGLPSSLDYRVEEFEPPRRAVLVGTTLVCTATDTIVVEPMAEGCKVTWQADIHFAGPIALLDPLFAWLFSSSVKAAVQEMRYCLDRLEGRRPVKKASARKAARRK